MPNNSLHNNKCRSDRLTTYNAIAIYIEFFKQLRWHIDYELSAKEKKIKKINCCITQQTCDCSEFLFFYLFRLSMCSYGPSVSVGKKLRFQFSVQASHSHRRTYVTMTGASIKSAKKRQLTVMLTIARIYLQQWKEKHWTRTSDN